MKLIYKEPQVLRFMNHIYCIPSYNTETNFRLLWSILIQSISDTAKKILLRKRLNRHICKNLLSKEQAIKSILPLLFWIILSHFPVPHSHIPSATTQVKYQCTCQLCVCKTLRIQRTIEKSYYLERLLFPSQLTHIIYYRTT